MKAIIILIVLNIVICQFCSSQFKDNQILTRNDSIIYKNNIILKDYFLCRCIEHGFEKDSILNKDHSTNVLIEMSDYYPDAFWKIDSIAKERAYEIPISNYTGKRGILFECISYYKSNKLDSIITELNPLIDRQ